MKSGSMNKDVKLWIFFIMKIKLLMSIFLLCKCMFLLSFPRITSPNHICKNVNTKALFNIETFGTSLNTLHYLFKLLCWNLKSLFCICLLNQMHTFQLVFLYI